MTQPRTFSVVPGSVLLYLPVVASEKFDEEAKQYVQSLRGGYSQVWKYGIGRCEHIVIVELEKGAIFHYDRYPLLTPTTVRKSAKLASTLFTP